jgi:hypothetical protein
MAAAPIGWRDRDAADHADLDVLVENSYCAAIEGKMPRHVPIALKDHDEFGDAQMGVVVDRGVVEERLSEQSLDFRLERANEARPRGFDEVHRAPSKTRDVLLSSPPPPLGGEVGRGVAGAFDAPLSCPLPLAGERNMKGVEVGCYRFGGVAGHDLIRVS